MSYRYLTGSDGRRYCFSVHTNYRCRNAHETGRPEEPARQREVIDAADALACIPEKLTEILSRAHGNLGARRRRESDGRLTEDCDVCGRRLERLGFAYFIAARAPQDSSARRIAARLGASGYQRVEGPWHANTKRDARQWAHGRVDALKRR